MAVRISKNFRGAQNTRAAFAYLPTLAFHFFAGSHLAFIPFPETSPQVVV
jgi:hypothetical protein